MATLALLMGAQALGWVWGATPNAWASKSAKAASTPGKAQISDALNARLEKALAESANQLGSIEPWQEKLFSEEVVREPQRFIRDYRASRTGIDVDVDMESVRNYLRYYAPRVYKKGSPQIAVAAVPGADCSPCQAKLPVIRQILKERLEHRGFTVLMTKPLEQEALSKFSQDKKAEGTLWVSFGPAPADETDSAHADEIRYAIKAVLDLQSYPKQEGSLEIFETGSFERSVSRLMTDFFTEIGSKTDQALAQGVGASSASDGDSSGISLEIHGIKSYGQYLKLKEKLRSVGESAAMVMDERRVSSGKVVFIARTDKGSDKGVEILKKALSNAVIAPAAPGNDPAPDGDENETRSKARLHLINASDQRLEMEIRP